MGSKPTYSGNNAGPLREILVEACQAGGFSMKDLTVLDNDPYRIDTPAGHRDGKWFAGQIARFAGEDSTVHLRGLHYLIASSGDVVKPADGAGLYVNSDEEWGWLQEHAARAGRWLGYVPFERILDARNDEADLYIPEYSAPDPGCRKARRSNSQAWKI
jgi:hypothetical protein